MIRSGGDLLEVDGLSRAFGAVQAVRRLSLRVGAGDVVGLLGPNGAGKTTAISCAVGLLRPDEGRVLLFGHDPWTAPQRAHKRLAAVFQRLAVYPGLDVRTNLDFYAGLSGARGSERARRVAEAVARLELGALLERRCSTLSVGQQRLVHVATALAALGHGGGLLVLDEATAGLDLHRRARVLEAVRSYAEKGAGVLYSSHYLEEVERLCRRVVILYDGRQVAGGEVADLIREHGGGYVSLDVDGGIVTRPGADVAGALASVPPGATVRAVRVVEPSLEAVFTRLTGSGIQGDGADSTAPFAAL